jgi:hypothetical protein
MIARAQLPNRRRCETFEFRHAGHAFTLCAGFYRDGRVAEIFLSARHVGSPLEAIARDAAIVASIAPAKAHAVRIKDKLARRGFDYWTKPRHNDIGQSCPICGGTDRFAVNTEKQVFNCRSCNAKGDVIALSRLSTEWAISTRSRIWPGRLQKV